MNEIAHHQALAEEIFINMTILNGSDTLVVVAFLTFNIVLYPYQNLPLIQHADVCRDVLISLKYKKGQFISIIFYFHFACKFLVP